MKKESLSKTLSMLDKLSIGYEIKNDKATLSIQNAIDYETKEPLNEDFSSLTIELGTEYTDFWKRWSTGASGRNYKDLLSYLIQEKVIDPNNEQVKEILPHTLQGTTHTTSTIQAKTVQVNTVERYDFDKMVTNPHPFKVKRYLRHVRQFNDETIQFLFDHKLVVQDGRSNLRYLWYDQNQNIIGGDVQGTTIDYEKFGKRGTLKHILKGSEGFFHIKINGEHNVYTDVEKIIFFEAPADLIAYYELFHTTETSVTWLISLSGAGEKVETHMEYLNKYFKINLNSITFYFGTDNDEAGDVAYENFRKLYPNLTSKRILPNDGDQVFLNGKASTIKDWNDYLKFNKGVQ